MMIGVSLLSKWQTQARPKFNAVDKDGDPLNRKQLSRDAELAPHQGWHPEEKRHRRQETRYWFASILLTLSAGIGAFLSAQYAY